MCCHDPTFQQPSKTMYAIILGFLTAFTLTYTVIPSIIRVASIKNLFDRPNDRSAHVLPTPSLGGIGIFAGAVCGIILWTPFQTFGELQYILASCVILFLIGVKDDLVAISPTKKFVAQILCALILVYKSHIRITSLHGIFGIHELPEMFSFALSIVAIVGIINAFNLIDGINGLAGSISVLACLIWGTWFFLVDHIELAIVAFSVAGAALAFLKYNITPAKIFMGDTGSLLIGMVCAVLAIKFIELQGEVPPSKSFSFSAAAPAIAIAILILPLYDTARVFIRRILQGKSPFYPDKTHIHHLLLDTGLTHMQATAVLIGVNVFFVALVVTLSSLGTMPLLLIEAGVAVAASTFLYRLAATRRKSSGKMTA